jgi:hypothetical protein
MWIWHVLGCCLHPTVPYNSLIQISLNTCGSGVIGLVFHGDPSPKSISTLPRWRDLASPPFDAALQKKLPHPSPILRPWLPRPFKLLAPLTILAGEHCSCCAHIPGPHPLAIPESCHFWVEATLQGIFLIVFRVEEPVCKARVGECHPKKI